LWWVALEAVIAQNSRIATVVNGKDQFFRMRPNDRKARAV
jgi:hypothetical protein